MGDSNLCYGKCSDEHPIVTYTLKDLLKYNCKINFLEVHFFLTIALLMASTGTLSMGSGFVDTGDTVLLDSSY